MGLPAGIVATFSQDQIDVPSGLGNFREVQMTVTSSPGTVAGPYPFTVKALSHSLLKPVSDTAAATLNVVSQGVQVGLNPPSGAPGDTFQMTVTNTGAQQDTFDLSIAGPAALLSVLEFDHVTLGPGDMQVVNITVGQFDFADAGTLNLTAVAISQANNTIRSSADADVSIVSTQGMNANFTPDAKLLPIPGSTSFLLFVNNIGNTADSFTATITGISGPVTASLTDLNGLPAQIIPVFRLPGLFSSALLLQTNLSAAGQGTVTVQVRSLNNSERTASATATITANALPNSAPTNIILSSNTVAENQPIGTTVGTFTTSDPDSGNTFTYSLVTGQGADDNSSFTLSPSGQLTTNAALNFETQGSYVIRMRSTDQGGLFFEKQFTITVSNIDEPPEIVLTPGVRMLTVPVKKLAFDPLAKIRDVDTPVINLANCTVQVKVTEHAAPGDKVRLLRPKRGEALVIKGKHILYQGKLIGERIYGKKGGIPLTVKFNGDATQSGVEAVLDKIYYRTKGTAGATRKLQFSLTGLANGQSSRTTKDVELR